MINYYLIVNNCNGVQYGIGTYVNQTLEGLKKRNNFSLAIIELSANVKEFTYTTNHSGISKYRIPAVNTDMDIYCKLAYYLIKQYIPQSEQMVFHFNFMHHEPLMHYMREYYSDCRIILTVHYLGWCFELRGNYLKFKKIINSGTLSSKDLNVITSFKKEKQAYHSSDEVIVLSETTKSILINDYKIPHKKVHLIRNGLSGRVMQRGVQDNEMRILFVGRIDAQKGLNLVLNAFMKIAPKVPSAKLYVIGDGDYNSFLPLCKGFWDRITFTGRMNSKELNKIYSTAALGVLPSYHEQCSYTIIEMLKYGIPLITSDRMDILPDFTECVVPIPYISKLKTESISYQLSEKMLSILTDTELRQVLSEKSRAIFKKYHTQGQMATALHDMIVLSLNRRHYCVPDDYLNILDKKMFAIIHKKPDIDFQFYGLGGICAYLWYRIESLRFKTDILSKEQFYDLQKFLLFYVDWIDELLDTQEEEEIEICHQLPKVLMQMLEKQFYKTKTQKVLNKISTYCATEDNPMDEKAILKNAIRIYNCSI